MRRETGLKGKNGIKERIGQQVRRDRSFRPAESVLIVEENGQRSEIAHQQAPVLDLARYSAVETLDSCIEGL